MKFLPQRAVIEAFGGGGFRFAAMSHQGALLVLPNGMHAWPPLDIPALLPDHFSALIDMRDAFDVLLIGTGPAMLRLPPDIVRHLTNAEVRYDVMSTSAAVHTYNIMLTDNRRVAAALLPVARAHG